MATPRKQVITYLALVTLFSAAKYTYLAIAIPIVGCVLVYGIAWLTGLAGVAGEVPTKAGASMFGMSPTRRSLH
jgi:hypothetical protein